MTGRGPGLSRLLKKSSLCLHGDRLKPIPHGVSTTYSLTWDMLLLVEGLFQQPLSPAEAVVLVAVADGAKRLVVQALDSKRFAKIFLEGLQPLKVGGQRWSAQAAGGLEHFHEAAIHQGGNLGTVENAGMLDARLAALHFLRYGGAAVPQCLGAPVGQNLDLKAGFLECVQTVLKRDLLAGGVPEEHASIIKGREASPVTRD